MIISEQKEKIDSINQVSPSFCLAKWTQVTLDLVHGTTHSCHHPKRHAIDPDKVLAKPELLHNTPFKKHTREQMLRGERPEECGYCWTIEDTKGEHLSDRMVKSLDPWSYPYLDDVIRCGAKDDYAPHYVEVMFDSTCNLGCSYCLADISTTIKKEMNKWGRYPIQRFHHRMPDPEWKRENLQDRDVFKKAFWKWLPSIYKGLHVLRVTGGEPFLSPHTLKLLDYIEEHPHPTLEVSINSNLSLPIELMDKVMRRCESIRKKGGATLTMYASVDAFGAKAEYIRANLNFSLFEENLRRVLDSGLFKRVTIMNTFTIFSMGDMNGYLKWVWGLKEEYPNLTLDVSYLREPSYLRASIALPSDYEKFKQDVQEVLKGNTFSEFEKNKLKRIDHWLLQSIFNQNEDENLKANRADFFSFVNEYDQRYGGKFLEVFPSLKDLYIECKKERFLLATGNLQG